jgi:hypothetical protein
VGLVGGRGGRSAKTLIKRTIVTKFTFQLYVRQKGAHPSDTLNDGVTLKEAADLFKASIAAMGDTPCLFNSLVKWRGADGEKASIRYDSFMSHKFKCCLAHAEEAEVLAAFNRALQNLN